MVKVLKATISGSFVAADKQTESYGKVEGLLPLLDEDKATQQIIKRYAKIWIANVMDKGKPLYKRVQRMREVFVDSLEEVEVDGEFSFVGKSIMDMNYEELQDLAACKDLQGIPVYKEGSLANQRRIAFAEYGSKVLGLTMKANKRGKIMDVLLDHRLEGFSPSNYQPIVVDDADTLRHKDEKIPLEESIDREALALQEGRRSDSEGPEARMTIEQLRKIADLKKVKYSPRTSWEALYKQIYGTAAA